MRNDLYITLERGEFEKGGKSVARNVEVTVYVLDIDGQILKVTHSTPTSARLKQTQGFVDLFNMVLFVFSIFYFFGFLWHFIPP